MEIGRCKLCLEEKELCKKSHIIPNFMYKEIYDDKHSLISFKTHTTHSERVVFNGAYDSNILCLKCDNELIGGFEDYARQILYGGKIPVSVKNFRKPDGLEFSQAQGVDYTKFKLFLLSVLWRASVSGNDFFSAVSLGSIYEEKIRQMILNKNAGLVGDFPCILTSYRKRNFPKALIMAPKKFRMNNQTAYNFLIGGISYMFKIIEGDPTDWVLEGSINKNGELNVYHIPEDQAKRTLSKMFGAVIPDNLEWDKV